MEVTSSPYPIRIASTRRTVARRLIILTAMTLSGIVQPAIGQSSQPSSSALDQSAVLNQRQDDVSFADYKFRDGETLPELRIHYT
ncbi:MAG TPA: hypothetical protein VGK96_16905, partial [Candidatus Sulfotelmatobacter sp.]